MSGPPNLWSMVMLNELRQAEFQAEAARDRLGRLAQGNANQRPRWAAPSAVVVVVAVALLFAIGAAAAL